MFCKNLKSNQDVKLTQQQIDRLLLYVKAEDVEGGWKYLASLGDRYADNAAAIISSDGQQKGLNLWMKNAVAHIWNLTVGTEVRQEKFKAVALSHFENYVDYIDRNQGKTPDTLKIEESYALALDKNGVSVAAAIDLQINTVTQSVFDQGGIWGIGLAMDLDRLNLQEYLTVAGDTSADNAAILATALGLGAYDSIRQKGKAVFIKEVIEDLADMWRQYYQEMQEQGWLNDGNRFCLPSHEWVTPYQNLNRSGQFHTYDPLALDLDGDGLETVGTRRLSGSLFDHDADGIRTASGWVSADDGFLVYDRNGNGLIDSGRELFGDHTLLSDGSRAAHGYAALAELDSDGNGRVDAADKDFSSLRVWRDLNQDGISQGGELFSLADVGVQALNLAHTTPNTDLGNGNFLAQSGSYTQTDGSTAQMGDLDLAADHLFSRFTDSVELTAEQMRAPNLQGMGRLRDLREAAALSGSLTKIPNAGKRAVNDGTWGFQVA